MAVLERSDLEASPLADLHAIADQLGLDGFRRLRKGELIDAILSNGEGAPASVDRADEDEPPAADRGRERPARARRRGGRSARSRRVVDQREDGEEPGEAGIEPAAQEAVAHGSDAAVEGVVEVLPNGSGFLRVSPPDPSDDDVYISAAQVRRCELVSGDRVSGPMRTRRRSERYPSLVRVETINGAPADEVADGARYEDQAVAYPSERLALGAGGPTLESIEWLTPLGRGSRAVVVGPARSGKTETLKSVLEALAGRGDLHVTLVLVGVRPEEVALWQEGPVAPACSLTFAASADAQGSAVEQALDGARRLAARGQDAIVLIDSLDGLHPPAARKALAAARNLRDAGSLTLIATASKPFGGETTVIALDPALTAMGRQPILDLPASGTLKPELLVGEDGARAINKAQAAALDASS
jgi:transcription termination factor Rho